MRYNLKEIFKTRRKKLKKFKSRKHTGSEFYCYINNIAVLDDQHTVIGVQHDNCENLFLELIIGDEVTNLNTIQVSVYRDWNKRIDPHMITIILLEIWNFRTICDLIFHFVLKI